MIQFHVIWNDGSWVNVWPVSLYTGILEMCPRKMLYFDFRYILNWKLQSKLWVCGNSSRVVYTWLSHEFLYVQKEYIREKQTVLFQFHPYCSTKQKCSMNNRLFKLNLYLRNQTERAVYSCSGYVQTYHKFYLVGSCKAMSPIKPYLSSYPQMTLGANIEIFPTFVTCLRLKNGLKKLTHKTERYIFSSFEMYVCSHLMSTAKCKILYIVGAYRATLCIILDKIYN